MLKSIESKYNQMDDKYWGRIVTNIGTIEKQYDALTKYQRDAYIKYVSSSIDSLEERYNGYGEILKNPNNADMIKQKTISKLNQIEKQKLEYLEKIEDSHKKILCLLNTVEF